MDLCAARQCDVDEGSHGVVAITCGTLGCCLFDEIAVIVITVAVLSIDFELIVKRVACRVALTVHLCTLSVAVGVVGIGLDGGALFFDFDQSASLIVGVVVGNGGAAYALLFLGNGTAVISLGEV